MCYGYAAPTYREGIMTPTNRFEYDQRAPLDIREAGQRSAGDVQERAFTYLTPFGERRAASLFRPEAGDTPLAALLYVHWYEPESPDSNRTQFEEEAQRMARRGAVALLIETMWSDRDWFIKRAQADDERNSIRQVVELRQAVDLLLAQPRVDVRRLAYVGHDFGAMYGVLMGSADPRPACYALMAGTPRFPDWYLYYPRLEGAERTAYVERMDPLDPIAHVARLAPAPLLFQFGRDDPYVPQERGQAFYDAASEPKQIQWYDCGHKLNAQATDDRVAWLCEQLQIS
jgi:dienelactone hydrolase